MTPEDLPRCLERECTGDGERPADGVYLGYVHMVFACNECADRAGVKLVPIPGDPTRSSRRDGAPGCCT